MAKIKLVIDGKDEIEIPEKAFSDKKKEGFGYYTPIEIGGKKYNVSINIYRNRG